MAGITVESKRLLIFSRTTEEMEDEYQQEQDPGMKQAYLEMYQMMQRIKGREELACDWRICIKDGTEIGGLAFKGLPDERGRVELGYGIDTEYQHQGYATEAIHAMTEWAFKQQGVKCVCGQTDPDNSISQRALLANGFLRNGYGDEGPMYERWKPVEMRRSDRKLTNEEQIRDILDKCRTCNLAMVDKGLPYVIPLSYGYEINEGVLTLYFHSALEGHKLDVLRENNTAAFAISSEGTPVFAEKTPCNSGYYYSSVIGRSYVEIIENEHGKCRALSIIMKQQAGIDVEFTPAQTKKVCVYKAVSHEFTGKQKMRL